MEHSYEEIRGAALDILGGREAIRYEPTQYQSLQTGVAEVLARREGETADTRSGASPHLTRHDAEIFLEVFWALFREGVITLGLNDSNREFPFFRVTETGRAIALGDHEYFFHDVSDYTEVLRDAVPDLHDVTLLYLQEAMQAFKAGCLLSATVMLGVAAEHTFLLTLDAAESAEPWKTRFQNVRQQRSILPQINKFKNVLDQHLSDVPAELKEDLDTHFAGILAVVRTSRNEAGHPTGKLVTREQTYVLLQLFVSYCKKMYDLRTFFLP
jgi:hypothetical protein